VNAAPKGSGTACTGANAPLDLNFVDRTRQIGHVHPENPLRFCIIHRYAVEGNVDSGAIRTPDAHPRITHTRTCVGMRHNPDRLLQQDGQILPQISGLQVFGRDAGEGDGCALLGWEGHHRYFHELLNAGNHIEYKRG